MGNILVRGVSEMRQGGAVHVADHRGVKGKKNAVQTDCSGDGALGESADWTLGTGSTGPGKPPPTPEHIRREGRILFSF